MLDRGVLFTESFVAQQTACIRGVFSAITKYVYQHTCKPCMWMNASLKAEILGKKVRGIQCIFSVKN